MIWAGGHLKKGKSWKLKIYVKEGNFVHVFFHIVIKSRRKKNTEKISFDWRFSFSDEPNKENIYTIIKFCSKWK